MMDSSLPVAVPPPYKSRRGWLIAFGVVEILIASSFLLLLLFTLFAFLGPAATKFPAGATSPAVLMVLVGLEYAVLAAVFITGGIGSIRCRNWARIFMLVVSGLWLGIGVITTLVVVFVVPTIMRGQPGNVSYGSQHAIIVGMIVVMTAVMVILPSIFLFFYSRKSVRQTCLTAKSGPLPTSVGGGASLHGLPVPLAFLGAWQALGACSVLVIVFKQMVIVFGVVLHGAAAVLVMLIYSVLSGYAAWGIFRQKLIGWKIALVNAGFWTAATMVTYIRHPFTIQMFKEMGYNDPSLHIYDQFPHFLMFILLGTMVMMALLLVFVFYTRKYFPAEE